VRSATGAADAAFHNQARPSPAREFSSLAKRVRKAGTRKQTPDRASSSYVGTSALVLAAFVGAALVIYSPSLDGGFISDDEHYVSKNAYVHDPTGSNLVAIFDPRSVVSGLVENYAPVHLLIHAAEWKAFGPEPRGYHVVNLFVHALAAWLLAFLFMRSGIPRGWAFAGGALFLTHPANVEAVAWISQLKTTAALVLALLAVLAQPRRPIVGALLFALALLAKPTAAVALPAVALIAWVRRAPAAAGEATSPAGEEAARWSDWKWSGLALWCAVLALFAIAEFAAFARTAGQAPPLYPELPVRFRMVFANALRYLVTAFTTSGLSVFHEPPPETTWWSPWWLASLVALGLLGWRTLVAFRRRSEESVYWAWAAISFAPVCGIIPLPYPIADRYLYFMLPGLIGALLLAGPELARFLEARVGWRPGSAIPWSALAASAVAVVCVLFALRANGRSHTWRGVPYFMGEAERNYPDGLSAMTRKASRAAAANQPDVAVAALNAAHARGYNRLDHLLGDPNYHRISQDPAFMALIEQWAQEWLVLMQKSAVPSQIELRVIAQAQIVLGDLDAAETAILRAIEVGGPKDEDVQKDLAEIRRHKRLEKLRRARGAGAGE
jgi:hypothetical protein